MPKLVCTFKIRPEIQGEPAKETNKCEWNIEQWGWLFESCRMECMQLCKKKRELIHIYQLPLLYII